MQLLVFVHVCMCLLACLLARVRVCLRERLMINLSLRKHLTPAAQPRDPQRSSRVDERSLLDVVGSHSRQKRPKSVGKKFVSKLARTR